MSHGTLPQRLGPGDQRQGPLSEADFREPSLACGTETLAQQTAGALDSPLGYPLGDAITEGDCIGIALGRDLPQGEVVVAELVRYLLKRGARAERVRVVLADAAEAARLGALLAETLPKGVVVETHDDQDEDRLCFAGVTQAEHPLLFDRTLFDADLLLPVLAALPCGSESPATYEGLYPDFFDRATIERLGRAPSIADTEEPDDDPEAARLQELDEAGWRIGVPCVVRVVPAAVGSPPTVLVGEPTQTAVRAQARMRDSSVLPLPEPVDLVIGKLAAAPADQTWKMVARALEQASQVVAPGGAIALWTHLDAPIGEALGRLADRDETDQLLHELSEAPGDDAWTARQMIQVLERGPLFLHSHLEADAVEELGIAPVASVTEMLRLASQRESCLLLEGAEHVVFERADRGAHS